MEYTKFEKWVQLAYCNEINATEMRLLMIILDRHNMKVDGVWNNTPKEQLAKDMGMDNSSIYRNAMKLKKKGLLKVVESAHFCCNDYEPNLDRIEAMIAHSAKMHDGSAKMHDGSAKMHDDGSAKMHDDGSAKMHDKPNGWNPNEKTIMESRSPYNPPMDESTQKVESGDGIQECPIDIDRLFDVAMNATIPSDMPTDQQGGDSQCSFTPSNDCASSARTCPDFKGLKSSNANATQYPMEETKQRSKDNGRDESIQGTCRNALECSANGIDSYLNVLRTIQSNESGTISKRTEGILQNAIQRLQKRKSNATDTIQCGQS